MQDTLGPTRKANVKRAKKEAELEPEKDYIVL